MKGRKQYSDDDGRRIADMSGLDDFSIHPRRKKKAGEPGNDAKTAEPMSKEETRMFIRGSLLAGLTLGLIFIGAAAVLILFLLLIWGKL